MLFFFLDNCSLIIFSIRNHSNSMKIMTYLNNCVPTFSYVLKINAFYKCEMISSGLCVRVLLLVMTPDFRLPLYLGSLEPCRSYLFVLYISDCLSVMPSLEKIVVTTFRYRRYVKLFVVFIYELHFIILVNAYIREVWYMDGSVLTTVPPSSRKVMCKQRFFFVLFNGPPNFPWKIT